MKKLLITGGSHSEYPVIEAAKNIGWYVISTGNDEGSLGHIIADKYVKGDFSDKEWVYNLAKEEKVDAIIFGNLPINKKRVEIRKLKKKGLEKKYIKIFLKLLEYISEVQYNSFIKAMKKSSSNDFICRELVVGEN